MFDLTAYATEKRLRMRNLHDGRPLHPLRVPVGGRGRSAGYIGEADRMDAIIGRHGYIVDQGGGRLGWYLFAKSWHGLNRWLPEIQAAGATVRQEGDTEVAGNSPESALDTIIRAIQPFKVNSENAGSLRLALRTDAQDRRGASGQGIQAGESELAVSAATVGGVTNSK
jgi:hypothetical protein